MFYVDGGVRRGGTLFTHMINTSRCIRDTTANWKLEITMGDISTYI